MQHTIVQQEQQIFGLQEDQQQCIEEISTLLFLTEEAEVAGPLLEELKIFQHEVEYVAARVWKRKEVRSLKRNELVGTLVAALGWSGMGESMIIEGSTNAVAFELYIVSH